jgi:hypothetical protein
MHVESVRAVERDDERQVRDLATEVQVHRVKQPEKPEEKMLSSTRAVRKMGSWPGYGIKRRQFTRVIEARPVKSSSKYHLTK